MTIDELSTIIRRGEKVFKRRCTVCGEGIFYAMRRGEPCLLSCGCRAKASSRVVFYLWEELRMVFADQEFRDKVAGRKERANK